MKQMFDPGRAQGQVWQRLAKIVARNKTANAYLFSGPAGSGKEATAITFAQFGNCENPGAAVCGICPSCQRFARLQHENLTLVYPLPKEGSGTASDDPLQGLSTKTLETIEASVAAKARDPFAKIAIPRANTIPISAIRELRKTAHLKTALRGRRFILIFDAHQLSTGEGATANALLKILEEPPENTTFILVTDHKNAVMPTIKSRCQQVDFPPLSAEFILDWLQQEDVTEEAARLAAGLAQGNLHLARNFARQKPEELQTRISDLVQLVINREGSGWRRFVDNQSRLATGDPEEYRFNFCLLQVWFRAAYRARAGLVDVLYDFGFADLIDKLNQSYPGTDYLGINRAIINATEALARNYYIPLTLTNFLTTVQRRMRGR